MTQLQFFSQPQPSEIFPFGILDRTEMDTQPHVERENQQHAQIKRTAEEPQTPIPFMDMTNHPDGRMQPQQDKRRTTETQTEFFPLTPARPHMGEATYMER